MQAMFDAAMVYSTPFNMYDVDMYGMHEKPNLITGEGRTRVRGSFWKDKKPDLKKKERRKMAKKSKRQNRRK